MLIKVNLVNTFAPIPVFLFPTKIKTVSRYSATLTDSLYLERERLELLEQSLGL